jgi:lysophospholipase L1-like esterase
VRTSSLGLRERELPAVKPRGEFRLMLLGDSVVFSLGVEYEDSIPAQLERALNEQAPAGTRYRTLNLGVPSYNTEQELVQLESLGLGLAPDAVALLFATNDIEPKLWVFDRRRNPLADCAQRSYAASMLAVLLQRIRSQPGETDPRVRYASFEPGNPRWEAVATALRRMAELLRARDIPFLVLAPGPGDARHLQLLRGVGSAAGFAVEQLEGASDPRWAAEPARFVNSATDRHCNALGCRIIAEQLAQLLGRNGLL